MIDNRKVVVAIAVLAATFVLGLVLIFVRPPDALVAHLTTMWNITIGGVAGAFMGANAVEHYSNGKAGGSNGASDTSVAG